MPRFQTLAPVSPNMVRDNDTGETFIVEDGYADRLVTVMNEINDNAEYHRQDDDL